MNALLSTPSLAIQRFRWLHLPVVVLVALLQRTPVLRVLVSADTLFVAGAGSVLKSAFAGVLAVGAVDTLVGATQLTSNPSPPASATVGQPFQAAISITGAPLVPGSYEVRGEIPPGLTIAGLFGDLVNSSTLALTGTPTTAGTYTLNIRAWAEANKGGLGGSPIFDYTIQVAGGSGGGDTAPAFTAQPQSRTINVGANVSFTVTVTGSPAPTLQWRKDGTAIMGATSATYAIDNVQAAHAGTYTVVATNSAGTATSSPATLTVNSGGGGGSAPTITLQPLDLTARAGSTVAFTVTATGSPSYQWRKDGSNLSGATAEVLVLDNVSAADAGSYTVVCTGGGASVTSVAAVLSVNSQPASRIRNLSVRTSLEAGRTLIAGFATVGEKTMLVRAVGPTLANFGVTNANADPELDFYQGQDRIDGNDDWPAELAPVFATNGAFALPQGSLDAALARTVSGLHTAHVRGVQTGIVLVEVYDSGGPGRLINVSARNRVGVGADVLIAGFVIDGAVARSLLIRAVGPKLTDFGVTGVLANPKLEIFRAVPGGDPIRISENDDWNPAFVHIAARAGAAGLPLTAGSRDATVIITLPPGAYSAVVSGVGETTGEALVEVYELP